MGAKDVVDEIEALYASYGQETYGEGITQLEHALQAAACASAEGAAPSLVAAALLHDIGHLIEKADDAYGYHRHDQSGADFLAQYFGPEVSEPVRLHVAAKRFLVSTVEGYAERLSPASSYTLSKQGGPMSDAEVTAFRQHPQHHAGVRLRQWDDTGKVEGLVTPPFSHYRPLLERLVR